MSRFLDETGLQTLWKKIKALIPTALKNPNSLTMQANGTTVATYDGSEAKTVNVTPSSIGLGNVNNTADANKSVKYASSAGNASTATKLATARTVSGGVLDKWSFTFDGSGNVNATNYGYWCSAVSRNKANYPYHRIASIEINLQSYLDYSIIFLINQGYVGGYFGIFKVDLRISWTNVSTAECTWIVRDNRIRSNCIQLGLINTPGATHLDVFYWNNEVKYLRTTFSVLNTSNSSSEIGRYYTLYNSSEALDTTATDKLTSKECYASIAEAGQEINGQVYSIDPISISSNGRVEYASQLATARTLTIGSTGKTFNGSANVTWSLSEIGAAANKTLSNENLNSVTTPGFYNAGGGNSVTNKPSGVDAFGLMVVHSAGGNYYTQMLFDGNASDKSYARTCNNGTWTTWAELKYTDTTYGAATNSSLGLVKVGSNITVSSGTISLTKANVTNALGYTPPTTNTTYSVATESANGLMSATDKKLLNNLSGAHEFTYTRTTTSSLYFPLFKVTQVAETINGVSVNIPPIIDVELVFGIATSSSLTLIGQLKCTLCLSSSPTIKWTVRNVTNSTYFGYIESLIWDKTNNALLGKLKSTASSATGVVAHAIAFNCKHATVSSYTSTSISSSTTTFSIPTSI